MRSIIRKFNRLNFHSLLNYHCPVKGPQSNNINYKKKAPLSTESQRNEEWFDEPPATQADVPTDDEVEQPPEPIQLPNDTLDTKPQDDFTTQHDKKRKRSFFFRHRRTRLKVGFQTRRSTGQPTHPISSLSFTELLECWSPHHHVFQFIKAVMHRIFPRFLWGSKKNYRSILRSMHYYMYLIFSDVSSYIRLRRYETFTMKEAMDGVKVLFN